MPFLQSLSRIVREKFALSTAKFSAKDPSDPAEIPYVTISSKDLPTGNCTLATSPSELNEFSQEIRSRKIVVRREMTAPDFEMYSHEEETQSEIVIVDKETATPTFGLHGHSINEIIHKSRPQLDEFEKVYMDLHRNPELACKEFRTAKIVASHLTNLEFLVHRNVGGTGVVGLLENGKGPVVLLRAEMDALPILEKTHLSYASKVKMIDTDEQEKPVMHACGHDMHVTCLMAAASLMSTAREKWSGTLVCLFQPNEERGGGAQAMIDDGLYQRGLSPKPDVLLGQHVVNMKAGVIATRAGHILAGKIVFKVQIKGRGGHGSAPQDCIDPVVTASYIVIRLQSIISRELDPNKMAVLTCGSIHAGDAPNIIPEVAMLKIDIRAYSPDTLDKAVIAFKRIVMAECQASAANLEAEITEIENVPPLISSPEIVQPLSKNFGNFFGSMTEEMQPDTASDDFSILAPEETPYAYWNFGSQDHHTWEDACKRNTLNELPGNHSAYYAPTIEPTLKAGVDAMAVAALTFLTDGNTVVHQKYNT